MAKCQEICDTKLTINEVEAAINGRFGTTAKITDWTAEDVGTGKGFLSIMARVKLTWDQANDKLPKSVMVKLTTLKKLALIKVPGLEDMQEKMASWLPQVCFLDADGKQLEDAEVPYIMMEDLSDQGGVVNMMEWQRLSQEQHKQIVRTFARLHSWSLKNDLSKFEFLDSQLLSDMMMDPILAMNDGLRVSLGKTDDWRKNLGPLVDRIEEAFMGKDDFLVLAQCNKKYGIPNMLCQGDTHTNNMLFKKDKDGKSTGDLMVLLDWQAINLGNPLQDIMRPMALNCDHANRTVEWRNSLLDVYYEEFGKSLGAPPPFTVEQLRACAQETYIIACKFFMTFFAGMVSSVRAGGLPGVDPKEAGDHLLSDTCDIITEILNGTIPKND